MAFRLRKWVVKHSAPATRVETTPALLPVVVAPSMKASTSRTTTRERTPIEVELPRGVVRLYGAIERAVLRELFEALSLVGAMMLEQIDEWSLNHRYMHLVGLQVVSDTLTTRLSAMAR